MRHQHPFVHTTFVAAGTSEVEVYRWPNSSEYFQMIPGQSRFELPPDIDHEIRALEDGTVVVNLSIGGPHSTEPGAPAKAGGVTMVGDEGWDKDYRPKFANPAEEQAYMREHGFPNWPLLDP